MRSIRGNYNQIVVSAYQRQSAINTPQTLDLSLLAKVGDIAALEHRREHNADELTGREEADTLYGLGQTSKLPLNFDKAQPQHFAFAYGYALGVVADAAAGTGFSHTITPLDGDLDIDRSLPDFTVGQRLGKTVAMERFASMFVNGVTATFSRDSWVKLTADCIGTGFHESSITTEDITAAENATSITLAANAVAGSTAQERLDAVHQVRYQTAAGHWEEVVFSAVSSATPAEITITAPGGTTDPVTFQVTYAVDLAWATFPGRVSETPLRVSEMQFTLGGAWDGSAFQGGKLIGSEINTVEHRLSNNGKCEFVPGGGGTYASQYFRDGRDQTLGLDREFRNWIIRKYLDSGEYFGARVQALGAEYETGRRYGVEMIFPKLGVLKAPLSVNGKRLAEKGEFQVLEHDVHGSVIVIVTNLAATYAAVA